MDHTLLKTVKVSHTPRFQKITLQMPRIIPSDAMANILCFASFAINNQFYIFHYITRALEL